MPQSPGLTPEAARERLSQVMQTTESARALLNSLELTQQLTIGSSVCLYLLCTHAFSAEASKNRHNNSLYAAYHQDNPRVLQDVTKPTFRMDQLISLFNSKTKARFCNFLIQHRDAFRIATVTDKGSWWKNGYKTRSPHELIDKFDLITQWVLGSGSNAEVVPTKIRAVVLDILDMAHNNLDHGDKGATETFEPIMHALFHLAFTLYNDQDTNPSDELFKTIRWSFRFQPEITNILDRLYKGSNSYNPYYRGCSKKLNNVLQALAGIQDPNSDEYINRTLEALEDRESVLYKAINQQRINFFQNTTRSLEIYQNFKPKPVALG